MTKELTLRQSFYFMTNELIDPNQPIVEKLVKVNGIAFEEQFVARVIGEYPQRRHVQTT
jgi:hypothetical protein